MFPQSLMYSGEMLLSPCCVLFLSFRDLLSKDGEKLDIKINPDGTGQLHVPGLRITEVKSFQHIKKVTQSSLKRTHVLP